MDLELRGRSALVFGAGGGLGGAVARSLAREGVKVAAADLNFSAAEMVAREIVNAGGQATPFQWNLGEIESVPSKLNLVREAIGPVSILFNNTGGPPPTTAHGQDAQVWQRYFQEMVLSIIAITDNLLPDMRSLGWGRIITSASSGVVAPIPNLAISNALRLTLVGWAKSLSQEIGSDGITVNIVVPGRIGTQRIQFLDEQRAKREGKSTAEIAMQSMNSIPLKRYGKPEEYADVVTFLASNRASYITGSTIRVDGGLIPSV